MSKSNDNKDKNIKKNNKTKKFQENNDEISLENEKVEEDTNLKNEETSLDSNEEVDIAQIKDQLLRTLAENENLRKRTAKDIEQIKKYGHITLVRDLLSSVDNLTRAVQAAPKEKKGLDEPIKNLVIGVEIVLKEINSVLEKNAIKKIDPKGEKFDYNLHQAMYEAPSDEFQTGTVIEVIQEGYLLHDRLVRPAMVGISKNNKKNEE